MRPWFIGVARGVPRGPGPPPIKIPLTTKSYDNIARRCLKRSNFRFRPKNHSQFRWRPFFFFFFGDHLNLGGKNVRISDFGRKITLNFGEDIRIFEGLCLKSPITKIFLIRHWFGPPQSKILATPMPWLLHYLHKKVWCGPKLATFRIKTLNFTRVIHLNWLADIKLMGPGPPGSILL